MSHIELIKAIDVDINKHHSKASDMLSVVWGLFFLVFLIFVIYIGPSVAERTLPELEKDTLLEKSKFDEAVSNYESQYKKQYIPISKEEYEKLVDTGKTNEAMQAARKITRYNENINSSSSWLRFARTFSKLKVEDSKIESILKILPYLIGAILAGFLVTYRLHIVSAKELTLKKFEILSQNPILKISEAEVKENDANS